MRFKFIAAVAVLAIATNAFACTPPQNGASVLWTETIAGAYSRSQVVFVAKVIREETFSAPDGQKTTRAYLKPSKFFKGNASQAPRHVDKVLLDTCDQRPYAYVGSLVLVFAGPEGESFRVTPEQDKDNPSQQPYKSAIQRVKALHRSKKS